MAAASRAIAERIRLVDFVLQVRDARFLNFLQARARDLLMMGDCGQTITLMLVGIPNVGKSAIANALHQVGRISTIEKGKLKHATASPQPGEKKNLRSLKIASHLNIYFLDTPGILPSEISDDELCSKLGLTGAVRDCIVWKNDLAHYFLLVLNLSQDKENKKWSKFSTMENDRS